MKVSICEEDIKFLKEMQKELKEQNKRCTEHPIYCIRDTIDIVRTTDDYGGKKTWVDFRYHTEIGTDNDLWNYIVDSENEEGEDEKQDFLNILRDNAEADDLESLKRYFIEDINYQSDLEEYGIEEISCVYVEKEHVIKESGPFSFFEKDAFEHLENNSYHYTENAGTYATALWRSPRMQKLRNLLLDLSFDMEE